MTHYYAALLIPLFMQIAQYEVERTGGFVVSVMKYPFFWDMPLGRLAFGSRNLETAYW
jgi:hypothetical protein